MCLAHFETYGMRFVLNYSGPLPSNGDSQDKHRIRQALLPQLRQQWSIEPPLRNLAQRTETVGGPTGLQRLGRKFSRGSFEFVPLVMREYDLVAYLEVVLQRHERPGSVLQSGGDMDNRLKTLFDSLSIPVHDNQIEGLTPGLNENPFYCLLEDDSLVTGLEVRTERLLEPLSNPTDVRLSITAIVRPTQVTVQNLSFLGGFL